MCGLFGIATTREHRLDISDGQICRLRDLMTHRGPDDAGLWRNGHVALAHRRLAVLDPTPAGRQPMVTPDGRFVLVYNGEVYNEPELRRELQRDGMTIGSGCDTETVLHWLAGRGAEGLRDLRGMYALALLDTLERRLLLARDPLGIKPLYWWLGREAGMPLLLFASEPGPILGHPAVTPEPDMIGVSAYLTTIRTVLGERTLFEGVRAVVPGQVLSLGLGGARIDATGQRLEVPPVQAPAGAAARVARTAFVVRESVAVHLRADVPSCCLLSGGLDSAIVASVASALHPGLRTYCAGSIGEAPVEGVPQSADFGFARAVADAIGTAHREAHVDEAMFLGRWAEMVARTGAPLSTPNEVAINEVARRLRADGNVVTLSGEGADELFGGYDQMLRLAAEHVASGNRDPGIFQLRAAAWCPPESKPDLLTARAWGLAGEDEWLRSFFEAEFATGVGRGAGGDPLAEHLRFQRRSNLVGLLQRLDSATMLESVEGRTPFADGVVAALAESLPMEDRFVPPSGTKLILREAFAAVLPPAVIARPKASFPLPFQRWLRGAQAWIGRSAWLRQILEPGAIELLAARPEACWRLAWPVANLALWSERWWPEGPVAGAHSLAAEIGLGGPSPTVSTQ